VASVTIRLQNVDSSRAGYDSSRRRFEDEAKIYQNEVVVVNVLSMGAATIEDA
jgi:hypothetical protein